MTITVALAHLVRQGYQAWLRDRELHPGPDAAHLFAELMTDADRRAYEGLRQEEVERVLHSE
jgi:hypothetical protein